MGNSVTCFHLYAILLACRRSSHIFPFPFYNSQTHERSLTAGQEQSQSQTSDLTPSQILSEFMLLLWLGWLLTPASIYRVNSHLDIKLIGFWYILNLNLVLFARSNSNQAERQLRMNPKESYDSKLMAQVGTWGQGWKYTQRIDNTGRALASPTIHFSL